MTLKEAPLIPASGFGHETTREDYKRRIAWEQWAADDARGRGWGEAVAQGHDLARVAYEQELRRKFLDAAEVNADQNARAISEGRTPDEQRQVSAWLRGGPPLPPSKAPIGRMVATAYDWYGNVLARYEADHAQGATIRSMIARIDAIHANSHHASVRAEFTSDGTCHGPGLGRLLASREPRRLEDGTFYQGWIVE